MKRIKDMNFNTNHRVDYSKKTHLGSISVSASSF